jgi:hypothetical protein
MGLQGGAPPEGQVLKITRQEGEGLQEGLEGSSLPFEVAVAVRTNIIPSSFSLSTRVNAPFYLRTN